MLSLETGHRRFDHEKLIVYQKGMEFVAFVAALSPLDVLATVGPFSLDEITQARYCYSPM